ncbi:hypothetical protein NDU88_002407 [Pleurodeles waltl]|uniref:Uncharacterized protein n=1 Tax=Pleurodeles waltl TaxID=8319 RepID=A0AAV7WPW2_PLEWA|nr:hypothetical protein NDU88_002407 [Pleurodeles waltl]
MHGCVGPLEVPPLQHPLARHTPPREDPGAARSTCCRGLRSARAAGPGLDLVDGALRRLTVSTPDSCGESTRAGSSHSARLQDRSSFPHLIRGSRA